jgi:mutator protein MutT
MEVAAGLVFRRERLLITQRRATDHLGGLWEFPGGKRRQGETYEHCLARELMEEVGIEVEVGRLIEEIRHPYPERLVRLRFHACRWVRHEPRPIACQEVCWVAMHELSLYAFPAADARLLDRLRSSPELWRGLS